MDDARNSRFFAGIQQQNVPTCAGPCAMPILYWDASLLGLFYRVPLAAADALLQDTPLEAFPLFGKALVLLVHFEYRHTSVGPYGEIGLAIQCRREGTRPSKLGLMLNMKGQQDSGLYVVNLPVTTEAARAAGVEIWGYPKYVTGIETDFSAPRSCRIALDGEYALEHTTGVGLTTRGLPFITFTQHQGRLLRTVIPVGHKVRWGGAGKVTLNLHGDGPTARSIAALGMDRIKPWYVFRTDALRAILPHGVDVGEAAASPQAGPIREAV